MKQVFYTNPINSNEFETILVKENIQGFFKLDKKSPFYFIGNEKETEAKANQLNKKLFNINEDEALNIVLSSMKI
jgi:hypothetical protein